MLWGVQEPVSDSQRNLSPEVPMSDSSMAASMLEGGVEGVAT